MDLKAFAIENARAEFAQLSRVVKGSRTSDEPGTECAVVGCEREGTPHLCPYDQRRHYHGAIHYDCDRAMPTALTFKQDGWYWICDAHYDALLNELLTREAEKVLVE